jgi:penicillin-binding protein-related factor A (putative recombinase)
MKRTPEQQVKHAIMEYLKFIRDAKFFWVKSQGTYDPVRKIFRNNRSRWEIKGVSDILGVWKGRFIAIEVKSKTGVVSPEQKAFIDDVNRLGGIGFVARNVDDVKKFIGETT